MADRAFGAKLKRARQAAGYRRQQDFADLIGVTRSTVGAWESGSQSPDRYIGLIEKYLGPLDGSQSAAPRTITTHQRRVIRAALPDDEDYNRVVGLLEGKLIVVEPGAEPGESGRSAS